MKTELKKLALAADPAYRDTETDYRLIVPMGQTKRAVEATLKLCEESGLEYGLGDGYAYVYCTADELAECGLTDNDLIVVDERWRIARDEEYKLEQEQKKREKEARLVGQYEARLALYLEDPRERLELAKLLVETAKEVL